MSYPKQTCGARRVYFRMYIHSFTTHDHPNHVTRLLYYIHILPLHTQLRSKIVIFHSLEVNQFMLYILMVCIFNKYYLLYFIDLICNILIYIITVPDPGLLGLIILLYIIY